MPKTKTIAIATDRTLPVVITAAGKRLPANVDYTKISKTGRAWQDKCWEFYDTVGEYRYGCDWVGNVVSKAVLYLAKDGDRVGTGEGVDYVYSLFGGPESQGQMLREIGIHLTVAGELYVIGLTTKEGAEEWRIIAATELTGRAGKLYVSGKEVESKVGKPFIMRLWRPHPRKYREANSPSRAVLNILAELDALTKRIFAEIDSRLAGAGMYLIPSEATMPTQSTDAAGNPQTVAEAVRADLQEAMMTAVQDREDASALVPIVWAMPGEYIANTKHQTFWSDLDEKSIELRTEAIRRLALGLDMPPEVLTGTAEVNHWTAWQVDEAAIKAHAEPLLAMICDSLTEGYLRPLLEQDGMDPAESAKFSIEADTSLLRLRPNRSQEAFELYDRMQLSGDALRRETGFSEEDAPNLIELRELFVRKVASGSTTPELVAAALAALGVPLMGAITPVPPAEARPTPSLEDHPNTGPPEQPTSTSPPDDGLLGASEVIVHRALERAGNRLRTKIGGKIAGVAAAETYLHVPVHAGMVNDLLVDAFDGIDRFVACQAVEPARLTACLDSYCRMLLTQSRPHEPAHLAAYLQLTRAGAA